MENVEDNAHQQAEPLQAQALSASPTTVHVEVPRGVVVEVGPAPQTQPQHHTVAQEPRPAHDLPLTRGVVLTGSPSSPSSSPAQRQHHTARLSDVQIRLQQLRDARKGNTLMSRYLLSNSVQQQQQQHSSGNKRNSVEGGRGGAGAATSPDSWIIYKNRVVYRRKIVLLGYQEVGKTSLRKCFESEPFFLFRSLPDVKTTTGVEVRTKHATVDGSQLEIILSDFAGQEAYHSHTFFLTSRCIFGLVWKISAVEQDFQSSGINAREEERLYKWIAEVYAKFPRARIVLIATHLDELRVQGERSVEMILNKVEGKIRSFLDRISSGRQAGQAHDTIVGNFAVSCKTRLIIAAGDQLRKMSGKTISTLFQYLTEVAQSDCMTDREYPRGAVPANHMKLIEAVEQLKLQQPEKLLMPVNELIHMAVQFNIRSDSELLQVTRLMHSWDVVYLLNPHRVEDNLVVMLHPRWLSRMAAALFSYAHILRTPLHLRSIIGGLEYIVSQAEAADVSLMRKGFLRWPLARILFHKPLSDFLKRQPDDSDVSMCLQLLEAMNVLYPVQVPCDDMGLLMAESPVEPEVGRPVIKEEMVTRYYIPSLSPSDIPLSLKRLAPVYFHRGVRVRMEFNLLPDELWWRLQCRLYTHIQEVVVHQPYSSTAEYDQDDEELLLDGFRLKEADDVHNRWKDALWLGAGTCRVLACREGISSVYLYSAETELRGSEVVLQAFQDAVTELLEEYEGVRHTTYVACPNPKCEGWISAEAVASNVTITCARCSVEFDSTAVVSSGVGPLGPRVLPEALLQEAGDLLSYCLSNRSCKYLCQYLCIPYRGPAVEEREETNSNNNNSNSASQSDVDMTTHVEYLRALDKVVQAALFLSWMERVDEKEKRKRMLEVEPSPVFY